MRLTPQQYAQALYEAITQTNPKDHDLVLDRFVKLLAQNGDLGKHPQIEAEYHRLENKQKGISEAEVTVAREMDINSRIIDELNSVVQASLSSEAFRRSDEASAKLEAEEDGLPNKLEIKKKVDQGIIGGVVVRVDETLIDASVRGQLDNLNKQLKL